MTNDIVPIILISTNNSHTQTHSNKKHLHNLIFIFTQGKKSLIGFPTIKSVLLNHHSKNKNRSIFLYIRCGGTRKNRPDRHALKPLLSVHSSKSFSFIYRNKN